MKLIRTITIGVLAVVMALSMAAPARADVDLYVTPGEHTVNGRQWRTTCEPYSVTERCRTEIWGSTVKRTPRGHAVVNDWVFNNLTYVASPFLVWDSNTLSRSFDKLSGIEGGSRNWRSECFTALTGRGCRGWIEATVIETVKTPQGNNHYRQVKRWVLNHMIRFDSSPIPPHFAREPIGCEDVPGGRNLLAHVVDPDGLGYTVTFTAGHATATVKAPPGTRTLKHFHAGHSCVEGGGGVNLS